MGQKVHPIGFRLGINRTWNSRWFAGSEFASLVIEDNKIRRFLKKRLYQAGVSNIEIERAGNKVKLRIYTSRPGIIIGKRGAEIENLKKESETKIKQEVFIDIKEGSDAPVVQEDNKDEETPDRERAVIALAKEWWEKQPKKLLKI